MIALSEIILDPYYRTFKGFMVLIEKEWLSFGHQFAMRNGIYTKDQHEDQKAPIFLQWLDSVHQVQYQFPDAFEFNIDYLVSIASQCNNNLYGTFLYNNEKERSEKDARNKTVSIWSDLAENYDIYRNPYYKENLSLSNTLRGTISMFKIRFWEEFFLRNVQPPRTDNESDNENNLASSQAMNSS